MWWLEKAGKYMVNPEHELHYYDAGLAGEPLDQPLSASERLIRIMLMIGFVAVLAIEAWLLWQVAQFWL